MSINDLYPPQALAKAQELDLDKEFISWLNENWLLWGEFCSLALQVIAKGRGKWSADALCHVLRWQRVVRDNLDPTFKINNNRTSRLARLFNACLGQEFFETRRMHPGGWSSDSKERRVSSRDKAVPTA